MALEWQDVAMRTEEDTDLLEMRIEEDTDREEEELDRSTAYEFAPEPKKAKLLDSAPEIKTPPPANVPSLWDVDDLSDLEDPDSDIEYDLSSDAAIRAKFKKYCEEEGFDYTLRYRYLDRTMPSHEPYWNCRPLFDMQYKELYDTMKERHLDEVLQEKEIICSRKVRSCASLKIAKEIVKPHQYGDISPLTESQIICCLTDLIKEHCISEELRILKEYELFLLNSGYWMAWQCYRKGDRTEIQDYEKYDHSTCFDVTGYSLADVQECFEKWIFKLMPEEDEELKVARKHVERDDRNRKRMLFRTTRAEYITRKVEKAVKWEILSMDDLESELRNNKGRQPLPADADVADTDVI